MMKRGSTSPTHPSGRKGRSPGRDSPNHSSYAGSGGRSPGRGSLTTGLSIEQKLLSSLMALNSKREREETGLLEESETLNTRNINTNTYGTLDGELTQRSAFGVDPMNFMKGSIDSSEQIPMNLMTNTTVSQNKLNTIQASPEPSICLLRQQINGSPYSTSRQIKKQLAKMLNSTQAKSRDVDMKQVFNNILKSHQNV